MDPRLTIIGERLSNIRRIIPVASGKGGVGKTLVATTMALILQSLKYKIGLLDLDFHGPSCHLVLGVESIEPIEEKGIVPPDINGIQFMTIEYFAKESPLPLRGREISNAIIELLAITRWDSLDYLIVDLPPGMGDEALDTIRLMRRGEFLIVTTPSLLSVNVVARLVNFLRKVNSNIIGILENMRFEKNRIIEEFAEKSGIKYLGYLPFDKDIEKVLGDKDRLLKTSFATHLERIVRETIIPS